MRTPRRVRAALARAPTRPLEELLAALAPSRRHPVWLGVAAGALLTLTLVRGPPRAGCEVDERSLAGTWDVAVRTSLTRAFSAVDKPVTVESLRLVIDGLDRWSTQWLEASRQACELAPSQPALIAEARADCLEDARREVAALVSALAAPDAAQVMRAPQAVQALTPIERCADTRWLREAAPPPVEPERRAAVQALEAELARGRGLRDVGRLRDAKAVLTPVLMKARAVAHAPLIAAVAFELGATEARLHDDAAAAALLEEALQQGAEGQFTEAAALSMQTCPR